jgi:photosystem II stability/assembly factor-like uncharacterized protein
MKPRRNALLILAITAAGAQPGWGQDVFSESLGPRTTYGAIAVAVDPRNPEVLFASSDMDGLFASRDGGATWQAVWSQDGIDHIEVDPGNPDLLYAAGYDIIRSTDGGRTWHVVNDGPRGRLVQFLQVNPHLPGVVYAGISNGILRSNDFGQTWHWHRIQKEGVVYTVSVDARDPAILYSAGYDLLKSTDGGDSWAPIESGLSLDDRRGELRVTAMAADPHESGVLTAGVTEFSSVPDPPGRIYRSTDGGASWRMISKVGSWLTAMFIDPAHPGTILVGTGVKRLSGTFLSTDGGLNWEQIHDAGAHQIVASPGEAGTYFAAMRSGGPHLGVVRMVVSGGTAVESAGWGSLKALVAPRSSLRQ